MFKDLRLRMHYYMLKRKMKKVSSSHQTCNFQKAKKIGVLFDASSKENQKNVLSFGQSLQKDHKKVHILGYVDKSDPEEAMSFDHLTKKDLNFFFIPKHPKADQFINNNYDLLINLYTEDCVPFEYISALSKAQYRVGPYYSDKTYCYDFMINLQENKDVKFLIQQINHYLNIIHQ